MSNKKVGYFGFFWKRNLPTKERIKEYSNSTIQLTKGDINDNDFAKYNSYLNELIEKEETRLKSFDPKAIQMVGQTSIVLTISGLFIPIAFSNINNSHVWFKVVLVFLFLVIASLFVYAILCALRNFSVHNFRYMQGDLNNLKNAYEGTIKFNNEILNDKVLELQSCIDLNNAKASNIIYAYRAFYLALLTLLIYIFFYCTVTFFVKKEISNIELSPSSIKQIKQTMDSSVFKIDVQSSVKKGKGDTIEIVLTPQSSK